MNDIRTTFKIASVDRNESLRRTPLQLLVTSLREDWAAMRNGVLINRIAASVLVPRVLRFLIYRSAGLKIETANIIHGVRFASRNTTIGRGTFVNTDVYFEDATAIEVGNDCQIGMGALFVTSHHPRMNGVVSPTPELRSIKLGDRVWIGARSTILPGITIGDGCVIAAGAVVTKDCEPGCTYGGVPARKIADKEQTT